MITIDDFSKVELKVAEILSVEDIEGADKLYKLEIDLGEEKRQLVAGIKSAYSKEDLVGKQVIVIVNLEPAKLRGVESQGMLLAADGEQPIILIPEQKVPNGTKIR
jgi:methionine--tRNA ligase beta chain